MSKYNDKLQINNNELQSIINDVNNLPEAGGGTDTSDATATASDILSGKTAYANGKKITGNIAFQAAKTVTPTTTNQTAVASGVYTTGAITVKGDSNLKAENIVSGVSIFGVNGNAQVGGSGGNNDLYAVFDKTIVSVSSDTGQIGSYMFMSCYKLTTANFSRCGSIGSNAFNDCSTLTTISFPACKEIGECAFYKCYSLTSAQFPLCTSIGTSAFDYCSRIASISFPACKTIKSYAFRYCSGFSMASFSKCTSIGNGAFNYCDITSANFSACTSVGGNAFAWCTQLKTIYFPVCKYIGSYAFNGCSSLTSASFPVCSYIGSYAFQSCSRLTKLILASTSIVSLSGSSVFRYTPIVDSSYTGTFGSIYVPSSLVASYKTASRWSYFSSRITSIV